MGSDAVQHQNLHKPFFCFYDFNQIY